MTTPIAGPALSAPDSIDAALRWLERHFPFEGYFYLGTGAQRSIAELVAARVPAGARILDLGCGPCDKTAVLSRIGYRCTGIDDFGDSWHRKDGNLGKIRTFAESAGIELIEGDGTSLPFDRSTFDAVVVCDVIEHLHASPRTMLAGAIDLLRDDGWLVISVPNALNLRKRVDVLRGRTNYPPYDQFFRSTDGWRGHVREYAWSDLEQLARFLGLVDASVAGRHHMLGRLPAPVRLPYLAISALFPATRDTLALCARKPKGWSLPALP